MNEFDCFKKRKAFHHFVNAKPLTEDDLAEIEAYFLSLKGLFEDIKTKLVVLEAKDGPAKIGESHCLCLYSEEKDGHLQNAGYLMEKLELFCVSKGIGTLFFGMKKPKNTEIDGLTYAILLCVARVDESEFRRGFPEGKRKEVTEFWQGEAHSVSGIVRFAPSACNSQPWIVTCLDGKISIFRDKKAAKFGIIPSKMVEHWNHVDIGIFIAAMEIAMEEKHVDYQRIIHVENGDGPLYLNAEFLVKQ